MFRIATTDGGFRQSHSVRVGLCVSYGLMTVGGVLLLISPVFRELTSWRSDGLSVFLVVGGLVSGVGTVARRWYGEFIGLPLLVAAFGSFAVVTVRMGVDSVPYLAWANGCLLMAVAAMLAARWRVALAFYRFVTKHPGAHER